MPRQRRTVRPSTPGSRIGSKKRDMRWLAPDGEVYDSRFEYDVYRAYKAAGFNIRRCTEQDSLRYTRPVRNGVCRGCGSGEVDSVHTYTPDFFVSPDTEAAGRDGGGADASVPAAGYYIEGKGYLRAERRSLLRALRKARPDVDLRFIVQRDYRVTENASLVEWARKFLKCPAVVWDGTIPDWQQ